MQAYSVGFFLVAIRKNDSGHILHERIRPCEYVAVTAKHIGELPRLGYDQTATHIEHCFWCCRASLALHFCVLWVLYTVCYKLRLAALVTSAARRAPPCLYYAFRLVIAPHQPIKSLPNVGVVSLKRLNVNREVALAMPVLVNSPEMR